MAEHDNTGIPVAYLLLSTATSIEQLKRKRAIASFLTVIRDKYNLKPRFVVTDKDLAEISAAREVWPESKHVLCQWHTFIDPLFKPRVRADPRDNEGDVLVVDEPPVVMSVPHDLRPFGSQATGPNYISLRLPPRPPGDPKPSQKSILENDDDETESEDEDGSKVQRVFCPEHLRQPLVQMMEKHADAHPTIRGNHAPSPEGVREWAVRNAYFFCRENELPELWAYLWENWYRAGRWELWARAPNAEIPRLRTTMIVESHWRHLKHDWLHLWPKMRLDMLVYTMIMKVIPKYKNVVDLVLEPSGRARDRATWRAAFKAEWRELELRDTARPGKFPYKRYAPDPHKWICACEAYLTSRFLICKHLIQSCHPVSPWFFIQAERGRTAPFWVHPSLVPLTNASGKTTKPPDFLPTDWCPSSTQSSDDAGNHDDAQSRELGATYATKMERMASDLEGLASYVRYQIPFGERRAYDQFQKQCSKALDFYSDILERERINNSQHAQRPKTWENFHLMFIYTKPSNS